jgi:hypothetical protein
MLAFRSSTLLKVARFPWHQPRIMIAHKIKQKDKKDAKQIPPPRIIAVTTSYICKPRSQFQCRIITQNSPLHQVWVLGEPPPLPEAVLEPPVANDTRVHLLRDFVLPEPRRFGTTGTQPKSNRDAHAASGRAGGQRVLTRWVMDLLMDPT